MTGQRPEDYLRLMETAAALGARRMKLVCDSEDHGRAVEMLGRLCDLAAPFGLVMDLEYMIFSCVKSLRDRAGLVGAAGRPNLRVLVDALHWVRAGDIAALATADPARLGYVQLCDGPLAWPCGPARRSFRKRAPAGWRPGKASFRWMIFLRRCRPTVSPASKCPCRRARSAHACASAFSVGSRAK